MQANINYKTIVITFVIILYFKFINFDSVVIDIAYNSDFIIHIAIITMYFKFINFD